jgi:hypothetical protein
LRVDGTAAFLGLRRRLGVEQPIRHRIWNEEPADPFR